MTAPVRLALIGAGIFARDAHMPALRSLTDRFEIAAIYSQSRDTAAALAADLPGPVTLTDDLPALLARDDIEAVDLVLPIDIMPLVVAQALSAGKHVISEKPGSPDVATGRQLLAQYARYAQQVWMVGENWRYEPAFTRAQAILRQGTIGTPVLVHWTLHIAFSPDQNKYYQTNWRRENRFPGGLLLDGGVHQVAALRMLLGEIAGVSAVSAQVRPDLPPVDTLSAALRFEQGTIGSFTITYAAGSTWPSALHIVGESGTLSVQPGRLELTTGGETERIEVPAHVGVQQELAAFAAAIREGAPHVNTPDQAVQDVAVIEAMLDAARTGQHVEPARIVGV